MKMHVSVSLASATLGEFESERTKTLPTAGCPRFYTASAVIIQKLKSNSKSALDRDCLRWSRPRNLTLLWEVSVKGEPRAEDCGATRWCGLFRKALRSQMSCRSPFSRSPARIVKRQFVRWQGAKNGGASSRRVPVWQEFGWLPWPDWLLRRYHCKRSDQASASSARKTKCRDFRRLNMFSMRESRMLGRQCQRLETLFRKWPPKQFPLALLRRRSEDCANFCVARTIRWHTPRGLNPDRFVELLIRSMVLGSHTSRVRKSKNHLEVPNPYVQP